VGVVSALAPWRVVVAGGGVAGIEALLGLHALGEGRLELALVTPENHFTLRPHAVGEPFGGAPSPRLPLADVAREVGARFVRDRMTGLAPGGAAIRL
jgi:sulfide:quinone oxidoreductase